MMHMMYETKSEMVRNEVLMYFGEPPIQKDENPLKWRKANEVRFFYLSHHGKDILVCSYNINPI